MMLPDIKHVAISNFRGIQKVDISFDKRRNLLIVGENGTGKSSIVDALEFFFTLGLKNSAAVRMFHCQIAFRFQLQIRMAVGWNCALIP